MGVVQLREDIENHIKTTYLLKIVSFVVTNTKESLKCGYYLWKLLLTTDHL